MMGQEQLMNFLVIVAAAYLYFMVKLLRGWRLFTSEKKGESQLLNKISIVIPFRNEAQNLPNLFASLELLDYPKLDFEVLLLDDHSTDEGAKIAKEWIAKTNLAARLISAKGEGKKAAQSEGVSLASYSLIACTDADCEVPPDWLRNISASFLNQETALCFGPVTFSGDGHQLQKLEFSALIASTMAMLKLGWPVMGNAANMAFRKEVFLSAEEALHKVPTASGDDVFLLHYVTKLGKKIGTFKALVTTLPQPDLKTFLSQRLRWAAKARYYQQRAALFVGALVLGVNVLLLAGLLALLFGAHLPWAFWILVSVKWIFDFALLKRSAGFFNQKLQLHIFLLQEILNVVYVPVVALLSQIMHFTWKGRRY